MTMDFPGNLAAPEGGSTTREGPMEETSLDEARRLLRFLADNADSLRHAQDAGSLLDETYRAAHSLKGELEQAGMPGVVRIARLVQDVVRAVRAGRIPPLAKVGSMLSLAARSALDSLEAHVAGTPDPGAWQSAARTLETLLAQPALLPSVEGPEAPERQVRVAVDARRLRQAQEAAAEAGAAAASVARTAEESLTLLSGLRALAARQERGARELLDAIPAGLAAAARSQPTTSIAGELSARVAARGGITSEFEESFSSFASRLREAAKKGERVAAAAADAASRTGSIRLATLFAGFERLVRRHAPKSSAPVRIAVDMHDFEIRAALADTVVSTMKRCARVLLDAQLTRPPSSGKRAPVHENSLQLQAAAEGDEVRVSLHYHGRVNTKEKLQETLSGVLVQLEHEGIEGSIEHEDGAGVVFSLKVPDPRALGSSSGSFILGRAGESLYAIPVSAVVKCIAAPAPGEDYSLGEEKVRVIPMAGTGAPRAGVVVNAAGGSKAVLLFDKLEGEERLTPAPIDYAGARTPGIGSAAPRLDGAVALIVDVASYVSAARPDRPRKR
jgi:chemotaxis protein histidine kinase CheA